MKAGVFVERGRVETRVVPVPEVGPGQVRVRVHACGVCGSDLHLIHSGLAPFEGLVLGHEFSATVESVGEGATLPAGLEIGSPCVVEPLWTCGACEPCRSGRHSICPQLALSGIHRNGGFSELALAEPSRLFPVPAAVPLDLAALTEPTAVVVHGLRLAALDPARPLLVLGAGTIGLLTGLVARLLGASDVRITARYPHQKELAQQFGMSVSEDVSELAQGDVGLVVETVGGSASTLVDAGTALAPGGTVCVLGVFVESPEIAPLDLLSKEARLLWSNCYARAGVFAEGGGIADFARALELIAEHPHDFARLVRHRYALEDFAAAVATSADKTTGAVKVLVEVG